MNDLAATPLPFNISGPLPTPGITVVEASAGTGKTFTLTSLVTRFVAEGVPLGSILAVTFTRIATGELRDRVRRGLVTAEDRLGRHLHAGEPLPDDDEVIALLATGPEHEVEARLGRLSDAVAAFDAATIATTHGFCQLVLEGLGSAGDVPAGATLLEDPASLLDEVVDDLYLRRALLHGPPPFSRAAAGAAAAGAVANPDIVLAPPPGEDAAGLLSRLAGGARKEVDRRLQAVNLLTYDRLLSRLADTLDDAIRGPLACERLRCRYQVVLVDEFQDTDPIQWRVMRTAFGDGATTLVLVGDPKQAIYSFRGADVHAYLEAAQRATTYTLTHNWRADQPLLDATDALLSPLRLGHDDIRFRSVRASADHQQAGTGAFPVAAPIRFRLVDSRQPGIQTTPAKRLLQKSSLVEWIAADVATDIAGLLASAAGLAPADVAVLTKTNKQSIAVREALRAAGIPAVVAGIDSVFSTAASRHWLCLLEAIQEPASRSRAAAAALTPFIGMAATDVALADERVWDGVHTRVHRWAAVLANHGVASLYRSITATEGLPARILATTGGERSLTDLGHVAQLLQAESAGGQLGAPTLRTWLGRRIEEAGSEQADAEERSRRLDSDAEAVQVLTVHRAKGLEFAVVYCPYLWDPSPTGKAPEPVVFHDPERDGVRTLDVGGTDSGSPARGRYDSHRNAALAEQRGEDLRLMYVALTRACHQVVVWWGQADQCRHSPLARLLVGRDPRTGSIGSPRSGEPKDKDIRASLEAIADRAKPGLIAVESAGTVVAAPRPYGGPPSAGLLPAAPLEVARFGRTLDWQWHRASYTSITAAAHADPAGTQTVGSEPEEPVLDDEPSTAGQPPAPDEAPPADDGSVLCPLGELAGGTEMGTFVHRLLEQVDFGASDVETQLLDLAQGQPLGSADNSADPRLISAGLGAALATPLGPLLPGVRLRDIGRGDRLDEMSFELPLAGGDRPVGRVATSDVAALLADYLYGGGPLDGYPDRLADPLLATGLRGYLTGSLDLAFRQVGGDGVARWYVADYKTNWLGERDQPLTTWHYRPSALDAEMQRRHYPLQALLYLVALHRYLRWRQPGYSPDVHLGGVLYLFLRGMVGPDTPVVDGHPCGVFSWAPPAGLIVALSDLLDSGRLAA